MVKMSETIICQRFIQNTWKKNLCSNCFKSKEDHVALPEKNITYRWTSHVDNFPQHSILKDGQKNGMTRLRKVSFRTTETEVIGFGGEVYSSDEEMDSVFGDELTVNDTDNEEEEKTFRKLTRSNTDFNSTLSNLNCNQLANALPPHDALTSLKLGKPVTDSDGRRQTLKVSVQPFRKSVLVDETLEATELGNKILPPNSTCLNRVETDCGADAADIVKNDSTNAIRKRSEMDNILSEQYSTVRDADANMKNIDLDGVCALNVLNLRLTDAHVNPKAGNTGSRDEIKTGENTDYARVSNVLVKIPNRNDEKEEEEEKQKTKKKCSVNGSHIARGIEQNFENMAEPLSRLKLIATYEDDDDNDNEPKSSIRRSAERSVVHEETLSCLMRGNCHPLISLSLITRKNLDIELDKPGSREMVGEPDGKADSDDSCDPSAVATENEIVNSVAVAYVNPRRSFLHGFSKEKPKKGSEPGTLLVAAKCPSSNEKAAVGDDPVEIKQDSISVTPKMNFSLGSCHGTGSTKRPAPKPPSSTCSPTSALTAPMSVQSMHSSVRSIVIDNNEYDDSASLKYESMLAKGSQDINFLEEDGSSSVRKKLSLELTTIAAHNRNIRNTMFQSRCNTDGSSKGCTAANGSTDEEPGSEHMADTVSVTSTQTLNNTVSAVKCSRPLSCDRVITPNGHILPLPLSRRTPKYTGATTKVRSTIKKFLRFSSKDADKQDDGTPAISAAPKPRRHIEIIHPLDLNKSSIEILRPAPANSDAPDCPVRIETECCIKGSTWPATPSSNYATCPTGRPNKPPPPPRTQSLDHKLVCEISKPARPPPPKSVQLKPEQSWKLTSAQNTCNVYENLGECRQGIAPAKPQRASSMRDRARQIAVDENEGNLTSDSEAVPQCDRNRLEQRQASDFSCERQSTLSTTYCGSETESDFCYQSVASSNAISSTCKLSDVIMLESETKRNLSVVHSSLEDNYGAVVGANHESLSGLLEQVNQVTLVPNSLRIFQTTLLIRFDHFTVDESSRMAVADWNFYNAKWNNQNVALSFSNKHLGPVKSLPKWIMLYPLVNFTDVIPSRYLKDESANAQITVWNEERIESIQTYSRTHENTITFNESGLLLTQLMSALTHLHACGIEDISLNEILICKRESDIESRLLLFPVNVDSACVLQLDQTQIRMSLCKCVLSVLNLLLPLQKIAVIIRRILSDEKPASLLQAKAVAEYWMWGPYNVTFSKDRQTLLQRWLDLERATCLHGMVCKQPDELSLNERCRAMFLIQTDAKTLTEASYQLEKRVS